MIDTKTNLLYFTGILFFFTFSVSAQTLQNKYFAGNFQAQTIRSSEKISSNQPSQGKISTSKSGVDPVAESDVKEWVQDQNKIHFLENKGQMTDLQGKPVDELLFKANAKNVDVYISTHGLSYVFTNWKEEENEEEEEKSPAQKGSYRSVHANDEKLTVKYCRADMELVGAVIKKENILKEFESESREDHYTAASPTGILNVRTYEKITIKNIYPGIDWVLYTKNSVKGTGVKYDFIVHPGSDPSQIKLNYKWAHKPQLQKDGSVKIKTPMGDIIEGAPISFLNNNHEQIQTSYKLSGSELTFSLGQYDTNETLIIDPTLEWASYYGANSNAIDVYSLNADGSNIWVTGYTSSANFPTANPGGGAYLQGTFAGAYDLIIFEFSTCGKLIWASYYGGSAGDYGQSIYSDGKNVWVTGYTSSADFPVLTLPGAYNQTTSGGGTDAFVLEFSCATNARIWATFFGGTNAYDIGYSINSDGQNVWVTGQALDFSFPAKNLSTGYNQAWAGQNAFILKFDCSTSALLWATCYGGTGGGFGGETAFSINSDGTNVYVTGVAGSPNITTKNPGGGAYYQPALAGNSDAFILKFNCTSGALVWATYYGGTAVDNGNSISSDGTNVWVTGITLSTNFPTKNPGGGAYYQSALGGAGAENVFILQFSSSTSTPIWATYYGGSGVGLQGDIPYSIQSDGTNVWVCGATGSTNFPTLASTCGYYLGTPGTGVPQNVFILQFSTTGVRKWATFYGNDTENEGSYVSSDGTYLFVAGDAYVNSPYPTVDPGGGAWYQPTQGVGGNEYGFVGRFLISCTTPIALTVSPSITICQGGSILLKAGGATNYTWSPGTGLNTTTGPSVIASPGATTTYTVTGPAVTGCLAGPPQSATVTVTIGPSINGTASQITPASCAGNNGSAVVNGTGGSGSLNYLWSNGSTGATATGLAAGLYTITITDAAGCTNTASVTINNSGGGNATASTTLNVKCNGGTDGAAEVVMTGGSPNYSYSWSTGVTVITSATSVIISGLKAGIYSVTVTDANGCQLVSSTTVGEPAILSLTPVTVNASCGNANGSISLTTTGGTGPFNYTWSNGGSSQTSGGLSPGSYGITVTDQNNCTASTNTTVGSSNGPSIVTNNSVSPKCNGGTNGSATVTISGGATNYTYSWSNGPSTVTSATSNTNTGLGGLSYTVTITDGTGCSTTSVAILTAPTAINPTPSSTVASCGLSNGSVSVNTTGGSGSYTYNWSNAASSQTVSGVAAGPYQVTVTDGNGCTATAGVTVNNSGGATVTLGVNNSIKCSGDNTGSVTASATGGTPNYSYSWSNGPSSVTSASTNSIGSLPKGTYTVTVTDGAGCQISSTVSLSEPPAINLTVGTQAAGCGKSDGTANVNATGGVGSFSYSWSNGATSQTAINLAANDYTVAVTDGNGCINSTVVKVSNTAAGVASATLIKNPSCSGGADGTASANIAGGTAQYTYSWSNGPTAQTSSGLTKGTYSVTITDANNCQSISSITLSEPAPINLTTASNPGACGSNGVASVTTIGGTPVYKFTWTNGATGSTSKNLAAGNYSVTVTDANNCTAVTSVTVLPPTPIILSLASTNAICGKNNGTVTASVTNGTASYTYSWSNAATSTTSSTINQITNLADGNYSATVTDANGCSSVSTTAVSITNTNPLTITPADQIITEGSTVNIIVTGGVTYTWSPNTGLSCTNCSSPIATPLTNTEYTVTATDINGCTLTAVIKITVKTACLGNEKDIFIANVFSPNNDGQNDVLSIEGNGLRDVYWAIYDRWGNKLFETTDQKESWNGTFKGKPLDNGTYVYYLKAICIHTETEVKLKGNVTIIR